MSSFRAAIYLGLCGLCGLCGCAVGPDYHGPPREESATVADFKNARQALGQWKVGEPADDQARGKWWTIFHDARLSGLIEQALAENQDLRVAAARIAEARALDRVAAADLYPNVDFAGSATRRRTTNTGPQQLGQLVGESPFGTTTAAPAAGGTSATGSSSTSDSSSSDMSALATQPLSRTFNLFRAPLDLSWEIDLFGRVRRSYQAARAQREAIEANYHSMALSIAANVATNYFTLRSLDSETDVLQRTIGTRREALRISQERLDAGLTSEFDLSRAQAELAQNEADVYALARTRGQVENALATLLGQPASLLRLAAAPLPASAAPPRIPAGLPARLLERRPDVAAAERSLAAANARIGVAKAAFFPIINLTGTAGYESTDFDQLFKWESRIWQLGPSVSLPIFEGGRHVANLGAARARYDQAVGAYRAQVLTAFQEVETALNDQRQLAGQRAAEQRGLAAARRAQELSQRQFEKGNINFLEVLDAERATLAAERSTSQLTGQRLQAAVQLIKALGGGWE